jgi:predicted phosphodiesterase
MRFLLLSDLHLEFGELSLPENYGDQNTVLVLAGDICNFNKRSSFVNFFHDVCDSFHAVVYVAGNHEYYDASIDTGRGKFHRLVELQGKDNQRGSLKNLYVLENSTVDFPGVRVIGATLWTSFRNGNPILMNEARSYMNDYALIRTGGEGYDRRLRPEDTFEFNYESTQFIFDEVKQAKKEGLKTFVVTHHAPTHLSVPDKYVGLGENEFYANHFEYRLEENGPDVWQHGHIHDSCDYVVGQTRVICNPRGYVKYGINPQFDLNKEVLL